MRETTLQGIERNGLRWRYTGPSIGGYCQTIGDLRDNGFDNDDDVKQLIGAAILIHKNIEEWLKRMPAEIVEDINQRHGEDLEILDDFKSDTKFMTIKNSGDPESELEEVVWILDRLYDTFDYHRIVVKS